MGLGYVEGVAHDYVRHGTITPFAALNVLNGVVLAEFKPRHRRWSASWVSSASVMNHELRAARTLTSTRVHCWLCYETRLRKTCGQGEEPRKRNWCIAFREHRSRLTEESVSARTPSQGLEQAQR